MTQRSSDQNEKPGGVVCRGRSISSVTLAVLLIGGCGTGDRSSSGLLTTATLRAAAQELVRQQLRDPSSAEFTDLEVHPGTATRSSIVFGRVNSRNGLGGMSGAQRFVVGGTTLLEERVGAATMDQLWAQNC